MAKTKWSIQDVREIFNELDKITGANSKDIEIKINGRLKRALARYTCYTHSRQPVKFDFGTKILNVPDFQALKDTAIHEYAHFIVNTVRKSDNLGHSAEFRQVCKDLGTDNYNATCTRFVSNQLRMVEQGITELPEEVQEIEQEIEEFEKELPVEEEQPIQEEIPTVEEQPVEQPVEQPKQTTKGRTIGRFDLDGNLLEQGKSSYFKEQGYPMGNVSKCCNGKLKTVKGFTWKYLD